MRKKKEERKEGRSRERYGFYSLSFALFSPWKVCGSTSRCRKTGEARIEKTKECDKPAAWRKGDGVSDRTRTRTRCVSRTAGTGVSTPLSLIGFAFTHGSRGRDGTGHVLPVGSAPSVVTFGFSTDYKT